MIITLTAEQLLAIQDLLDKIYLDHFNKPLDIYQSAQFSHDLYFWFQDQNIPIGKTNLIEFRKLFILLEKQRWQEFNTHHKRRKSLTTLNAICEASDQRSWTHYWKKAQAQYQDLWQEISGEDTSQTISIDPNSLTLSNEQNLAVVRYCSAALGDALDGKWSRASIHLQNALVTINQYRDRGR